MNMKSGMKELSELLCERECWKITQTYARSHYDFHTQKVSKLDQANVLQKYILLRQMDTTVEGDGKEKVNWPHKNNRWFFYHERL